VELIRKHKEDIEKYKRYQDTLDPELRYENTIGKIITDKIKYDSIRDEKINESLRKKNEKFREMMYRNLSTFMQ